MIHWYEPTRAQKSAWILWLQGLPTPELQAIAEQYPPWRIYRTPEGLRGYCTSIVADGRMRVVAPVGLNVQLAEDETRLHHSSELVPCEESDLMQSAPTNDAGESKPSHQSSLRHNAPH